MDQDMTGALANRLAALIGFLLPSANFWNSPTFWIYLFWGLW